MNLDGIKVGSVLFLVVWAGLATWAWQQEVSDFTAYKAKVKAAGEKAEKLAKETEAKHQQTVKEVSNAWNDQLPAIRKDAVAAYLRRYPVGVRDTCGGQVPATSASSQGTQGGSEERVDAPTCRPDDKFVQDCADDAGKVRLCRQWIESIGFPVGP